MKMKIISAVLTVLIALPSLASAQQFDLGSDLSGYRRFLVYPHLQQGWESMQRGERDRALTEYEQARRLAPENAAVALHLAAAYRKFGEAGRAETVLRGQLKRTPDDVRLRSALADLRATTAPPPAVVSPASSCTDPMSTSCRDAATVGAQQESGPVPVRGTAETKATASATRAPAVASRREHAPRPERVRQQPPIAVTQADDATDLRAALTAALQAHRFDAAERQADLLLAHDPGRAGLFDEVTYKLVAGGAAEQATRLLLRAYPFAAETPAERDTLFQRLSVLIEQQPGVFSDDQLLRLRDPLNTPALRSRQAALWANLQNCEAVRAALADLSPEYGYDDWMRLGDCSQPEAPALAQGAYARAHARQPGGRGSRALAYSAYASGDYRTALDAWRSVGDERLSGDELIAAVTTALAADQHQQAATWLTEYRKRGDALDHRYWSLLGQNYGSTDAAAATAAFERAVELRPNLDDYLRLARLDRAPDRQVLWLERAVDLDGANASVQLQLAYAYTRAGRAPSALKALERAAAIEPDNMGVQAELGYAYWHAGHAALAQRALERVWRADPANLVLAQQLVYVAQRLKQNETARWYAEQLLDAPSAFTDTPTGDSVTPAERRFGFQRLHEDLGRRVTINLDGFSGTHVGTATTGPQAGSGYRSYSQLEADVRLGSPSIRDGSTLSAYARVFGDGGEQRRALPSENAMAGVGLRWKPWRRQVIYLAAENQMGLDDHSRRDVLLRASASFFNGGRYGDDWHPSDGGWISRNLYLDTAHYLKTDYSAVTADYRTSYHRRIAAKQTMEPYGHLQVNGAWDRGINRDLRAGLGMRWNIWYDGTTYDADPHKLSLGVEFQQAFQTYLPDRNGVFVTLGTRW
jgi:bacteriophage N4 adsorption protein A